MVQAADADNNPVSEFTAALDSLTSALEDAAKAAQSLQSITPALAGLHKLVADLEGRMDRAREALGQEAIQVSRATGPVALAKPGAEPPAKPVVVPDEATQSRSNDVRPNPCFILDVKSVSGPLDLKAVDSSVNGNPDVVDVALLDYDGRRATLKVWFDGAADLPSARAALRENLQRHLGGQPADISIERSEESAA
jgi:hypothetical protein